MLNFKKLIVEEVPKNLTRFNEKSLADLEDFLEAVLIKIRLLKQCGRKNDISNEELFYSSICEKLESSLGGEALSYFQYKTLKTYSKFREALKFIDTFLDVSYKHKVVKKTTRIKTYILFASLTYSYLKKHSIPICFNSIINTYERFPSLLNFEFPAYLESGLLEVALGSNLPEIFSERAEDA